ncbi:hypothetical protein PAXRUDRAFT_155661, partial [Paxillus rubicundulus Ve08.2h10]
HPIEVSALLKHGRNEEEAKQWLAAIFKAHSNLSAAMGVIHPQMYAIGWDQDLGRGICRNSIGAASLACEDWTGTDQGS